MSDYVNNWSPAPGMCPFRYPSDPLMFSAWRGLIEFALTSREPDLIGAFTRDTGVKWPDGSLDPVMPAFIEWLNVTQWGEDEVSEHQVPPPPAPRAGDKEAGLIR